MPDVAIIWEDVGNLIGRVIALFNLATGVADSETICNSKLEFERGSTQGQILGELLACSTICLCKSFWMWHVFIRARVPTPGNMAFKHGHGWWNDWQGTWRWKIWSQCRSTRCTLGTASDLRHWPMNSTRSERSVSRSEWVRAHFFAHTVGKVTWRGDPWDHRHTIRLLLTFQASNTRQCTQYHQYYHIIISLIISSNIAFAEMQLIQQVKLTHMDPLGGHWHVAGGCEPRPTPTLSWREGLSVKPLTSLHAIHIWVAPWGQLLPWPTFVRVNMGIPYCLVPVVMCPCNCNSWSCSTSSTWHRSLPETPWILVLSQE